MSLVETSTKNSSALIGVDDDDNRLIRTSNLPHPAMQLTGHQAAVNSISFSPNGQLLASAGRDKDIFIWSLNKEDIIHTSTLSGSKADLLRVIFTADSQKVASASADSRACLYDIEYEEKIKTMGHYDVVNDISTNMDGPTVFLTVGDDKQANYWDPRFKEPISTLDFPYQLTSCALSSDGKVAYVSGIDETIYAYDARSSKPLFIMQGHKNIVTDLQLSSDDTTLLSNSMDNTLCTWDARILSPAATDENPNASGTVRALGQYASHKHDESWQLMRCSFNQDNSLIGTGSSNGATLIWDLLTFQVVYAFKNHQGLVTDVKFHPQQPIVASASLDNTIVLKELN